MIGNSFCSYFLTSVGLVLPLVFGILFLQIFSLPGIRYEFIRYKFVMQQICLRGRDTLGTGDVAVNKTDELLCLHGSDIPGERELASEHTH